MYVLSVAMVCCSCLSGMGKGFGTEQAVERGGIVG